MNCDSLKKICYNLRMATGPQLLKEKQKKKKLPTLKKLRKEADTLMQKLGRMMNPNSIIGGKTEVMHHLIPKSVSARLRYDWENLIPLTNAQHCRLHASEDGEIFVSILKAKGGIEWYEALRKRGRESIKADRFYYNHIIEEFNRELYEQGKKEIY